jgi:hypothetical protein
MARALVRRLFIGVSLALVGCGSASDATSVEDATLPDAADEAATDSSVTIDSSGITDASDESTAVDSAATIDDSDSASDSGTTDTTDAVSLDSGGDAADSTSVDAPDSGDVDSRITDSGAPSDAPTGYCERLSPIVGPPTVPIPCPPHRYCDPTPGDPAPDGGACVSDGSLEGGYFMCGSLRCPAGYTPPSSGAGMRVWSCRWYDAGADTFGSTSAADAGDPPAAPVKCVEVLAGQ